MSNMAFYMLCWFWFMTWVVVFWPTACSISNGFSYIIFTTLTFTIVYFACWVQVFVFKRNKELNFSKKSVGSTLKTYEGIIIISSLFCCTIFCWLLKSLITLLMNGNGKSAFMNLFLLNLMSSLKLVQIFLGWWRSTLILFLLRLLGICEDQWAGIFASFLYTLVT